MKRTVIGFCLVLLVGYGSVALLNLPTLNMGLLKFRGFCRSCDFTNANLEAMDLHGADLYYATLAGANLSEADLSEADLSEVDLSEVNLRGTNLTGTTFCKTTMPDGVMDNSSC